MKEYLKARIGARIGVTRAGFPKEVYFEGTLREVAGEAAVFEDDKGNEIAVSIDKIIVVGPAEDSDGEHRAGFVRD